MRVVIQRVSSASVKINGAVKSEIGRGLLVLLGVGHEDDVEDIDWLVKKTAALRIFDDEAGVMNRSVTDVGGDIIVVSQFTLMAVTKKGNRPSYIEAAGHEKAIPLYEEFCRRLSDAIGRPVGTGEFGADMKVALVNDGPVTICMDSKAR
jgi:D-tyrosyl-tRNA(Tyr) deacylase